MQFIDIFKLIVASLVPVGLTVGFLYLNKVEKFAKLREIYKVFIYAGAFGLSSILGTILGAKLPSGSIVNIRDASPIICGLIFSGPAGIIAGVLSGIYRFVSVYWTGFFASGVYTQIACSVATALSGVITALIKKFLFDNKRGTWFYGFFIAVLVEDFHMVLAVLTHLNDISVLYDTVLKPCALFMILANAFITLIAMVVYSVLSKEKLFVFEKKRKINTKVQFVLINSLIVGYLCISLFTFGSIRSVVRNNTEKEATQSINEVINDVDEAVDKVLKEKLESVRTKINDIGDKSNKTNVENELALMLTVEEISEINIVNDAGFISYSTDIYSDPNFKDGHSFEMSSGEQSAAFNVLLTGNVEDTYIQEFRAITAESSLKYKYAGQGLGISDPNFCYVQVGLNEEKYHSLLQIEIDDCAHYRHIKKNGYVVVADSNGNVVSTTIDNDLTKIDISKINAKKYGDFYVFSEYAEGYYIVAFSQIEESDLPVKIGFTSVSLAEIFVFLVLYAVLYIIVKRNVVDKIDLVQVDLEKISNGDLNVEINERSTYEFDSLSDNINKTVKTLKDNIEREANRNKEELSFAKSIQYSVLPAVFPMNDKFEIFASMNAAKTVGGDFYDFYYVDHEHVLIEIADVSGKGIPAAMFMMRAKTLLKSLIESGMDLATAFTEANKRLCEGNETQTFITAWAGIVDLSTGHVEFVNAGHNPPLICKDGKFEYLNGKSGFVLAGLEGFNYQKQSVDLAPGDMIYLYTDGVTEANDKNSNLYGEERLIGELSSNAKRSAKRVCEEVKENLNKFVQDAEQSDDITMLAFKLYNCETTNIKVVDATIENLHEIIDFVDELLDRAGASMKAKSQIDVVVDELFSNIAFYAYPKGQVGKAKISVGFSKNNEDITIIFEDRGRPYNPLEKEDPDTTLSVEEKSIGGLGIFIVKKTMDSVEYENVNGHNVLTLKKKIRE